MVTYYIHAKFVYHDILNAKFMQRDTKYFYVTIK